jgi:hypothetical protein
MDVFLDYLVLVIPKLAFFVVLFALTYLLQRR